MGTDTVLKETKPLMVLKYGEEVTARVMRNAVTRYHELLLIHASEIREIRKHTAAKIYPVIGLYEAMLKEGISKEDALEFIDWSCCKRAKKEAEYIQFILLFPGLYKLMPGVFRRITKKNYSRKAGFEVNMYDTESSRTKFDMTKCLYCDACKENGVPELAVCFCHASSVKKGKMHQRLKWNRTKTLGEGADYCDFDLSVKGQENR